MTSFNHYALGAVADWLHRSSPGSPRKRPLPCDSASRRARCPALDHAEARHVHAVRRGVRVLAARRTRRSWFRAVVPANTTAVVDLGDRDAFEVGAGTHEWRTPAAPASARPPLPGLDASLADVIDDPRAYRALLDTVAAFDADRAEAVRAETLWGANRTVATALMFVPPPLLSDVDAAIRQATA